MRAQSEHKPEAFTVGRWNDTAREYPRDAPIHELFERSAHAHADSIAAVFADQQLTYSELNARSNQLAAYLRKRGIGPDVLVGLCVERSLEMLVGLLGILKAGGAYVPLDPAYPRDRIAHILNDSGARLLITQKSLLNQLPEQKAELVFIDEDWDSIATMPNVDLGRNSEAHNLAYVIYTSGSTGTPKGVEVEHRSLVNLLCSMQAEPGLDPSDILAAVTTLCFDIAALEIYLPLITGARVVLVSREEAADGKKLQARLRSSRATVMQATPATWRLLLETGWSGDKDLKVLCGGEAFPSDLANKLIPRCQSVWNMYGPTETTIWSAASRVSSVNQGTVPIGHPIANTQFYIVDENLGPVSPGAEGQLLIGGDGLARGYRNRPDLTREKFIPDVFHNVPGARLYQTGDLARFLPDGTIAFLGRMDHQVKIRGYRIELGEIESVLASHPAVRQCVVIAREEVGNEEAGNKVLVAYLVSDQSKPSGKILREYLQTKLPDYMIPAAFVALHALPLTPNGKIDRKALPAPARNNVVLEREYVAPRNDLERRLAAIWEKVLKISPIGIRDNIFDLGVDSLRAAELFARIEKTMGRVLPPGPLFQAPTVESLAALLRQDETTQKWKSLVRIRTEGSKTPLFCVHGAAGTVFGFRDLANQLAPHRPVYGLQARGLYGRDLPNTTVEAMAAHYLDEIRTIQPHGPYALAGWCFGGFVAFEMAQQLRQAGEAVDLLALLNAPSSPEYNAIRAASRRLPFRVQLSQDWLGFRKANAAAKVKQAAKMIGTLAGGFMARLDARANSVIQPVRRSLRRRLYRFYVSRRKPLPEFLRQTYFFRVHALAERDYVLKPYPGTAVVFRDDDNYPDPCMGWQRYVQGAIEAHEIATREDSHRALMEEAAAAVVAERIESYLAKLDGTQRQELLDIGPALSAAGHKLEANVVE